MQAPANTATDHQQIVDIERHQIETMSHITQQTQMSSERKVILPPHKFHQKKQQNPK